MPQENLELLYEKWSRGERDAAEEVFRTYETYLRMVVRRQLSPRLRAKFDSMDVVQSVWADVLNRPSASHREFKDAVHLKAFLVRLTRNRFVDFCRRHRTPLERERPLAELEGGRTPPSSADRPSQVVQAKELWADLLKICSPAHRPVLELRRRGLSCAEIAAQTGLHEGSVRRILADLSRRYDASKDAEGP